MCCFCILFELGHFYSFCVAATAASHFNVFFFLFFFYSVLCKMTLILRKDIQIAIIEF